MLKSAFDGMGYTRANTTNDNSTNSTEVNSTPLVGGEKMPTKRSALFSRFVMLTFQERPYSIAEKEMFAELQRLQEGEGGKVLAEIIGHRETMEKNYAQKFEDVYKDLSKIKFCKT
ncbi:MAG: hypothetical protein IPN74_20215 [Haliscomenobacter sp.]|nr:hypothetical protein [Haliscomenobacter sp.]